MAAPKLSRGNLPMVLKMDLVNTPCNLANFGLNTLITPLIIDGRERKMRYDVTGDTCSSIRVDSDHLSYKRQLVIPYEPVAKLFENRDVIQGSPVAPHPPIIFPSFHDRKSQDLSSLHMQDMTCRCSVHAT